uniref:Cytosolic iron-sulfur assembly component 2B n=1 Tax=Mus musculus TaxID=10090 RepID=F8WHV1_MOUSE
MVGGGGSGGGLLENANPLIYERSGERPVTAGEEDEEVPDSIDAREIFDLIRSINDPEHPLTLEELNVVEQVRIQRPREHSSSGLHTHHPTLQHGHAYWPLHQSQAAAIPSPAVQDGCTHYTRDPRLRACSEQTTCR